MNLWKIDEKIVESEMNMKNKKLNKVTLYYIYLQPIFDVIAALLINNDHSNIVTSIIRLTFMLFLTINLIIQKYDKKKQTILYLIILFIYFILSLGIQLNNTNMYYFTYELKSYLSTFYFVILLISFKVLYKNKVISENKLKEIYMIYLSLVFIPNILNVGFDSYAYAKLGKSGWFYSANVVGSILVLLIPYILSEIYKSNIFEIIVISFMTMYTLVSLGTKSPLLAFLIILFGNGLYYLIKNKRKLHFIPTMLVIIIFTSSIICIIPKTSFYKNLEIHYNFLKNNEVEINSLEFLDHFIFSQRLTFARNTKSTYDNSGVLEKLFGIGYVENKMTEFESAKTIEIDYLDIYFRHGLIGFIVFFIPVVYITAQYIKNITFTHNGINALIALILIILLALFQGHIFITPPISIYVALILSGKLNNA